MPAFQRMVRQLRLALGARPEVDAAILQRRVEAGAGQPSKAHAVAGLTRDAPGQFGQFAACHALGIGVDGRGELVVADVEDALRNGIDRKSVVEGKSVSVRVALGGRRIIKKKTKKEKMIINNET